MLRASFFLTVNARPFILCSMLSWSTVVFPFFSLILLDRIVSRLSRITMYSCSSARIAASSTLEVNTPPRSSSLQVNSRGVRLIPTGFTLYITCHLTPNRLFHPCLLHLYLFCGYLYPFHAYDCIYLSTTLLASRL
jgi:hypothetical protein